MASTLNEQLTKTRYPEQSSAAPHYDLLNLLGERSIQIPHEFSDATWLSLRTLFPEIYLTGSIATPEGQYISRGGNPKYLLTPLLDQSLSDPITSSGIFGQQLLNSLRGPNVDITGVLPDDSRFSPDQALVLLDNLLCFSGNAICEFPPTLNQNHYLDRSFPQVTIHQEGLTDIHFRIFTQEQWQNNSWNQITNLRLAQTALLNRNPDGQLITTPTQSTLPESVQMLLTPATLGSWCQHTARTLRTFAAQSLTPDRLDTTSFINHLPDNNTISSENFMATMTELFVAFTSDPHNTITLLESTGLSKLLPHFDPEKLTAWSHAFSDESDVNQLTDLITQPPDASDPFSIILTSAQTELFGPNPIPYYHDNRPQDQFFSLSQLAPLLRQFSLVNLSDIGSYLPTSLSPNIPENTVPNQQLITDGLNAIRTLLPNETTLLSNITALCQPFLK